MILKVEGMENTWTFVGEVDECSNKLIVCETEEGFEELRKKCDTDFTDLRPWGENITHKKVKWISWVRKGYDEATHFLCDGQVFLLSDLGKTIERL